MWLSRSVISTSSCWAHRSFAPYTWQAWDQLPGFLFEQPAHAEDGIPDPGLAPTSDPYAAGRPPRKFTSGRCALPHGARCGAGGRVERRHFSFNHSDGAHGRHGVGHHGDSELAFDGASCPSSTDLLLPTAQVCGEIEGCCGPGSDSVGKDQRISAGALGRNDA